ncbi:hypothetical protein BKH42_08540 [Helicobacter sp. 13S00482-2]|nr:hypothetical protein BKH42_08540 [Helicobacter sp. 13S00482-2]
MELVNAGLAKEFLEGIKHFYDFKTKILSKYSIKDIEYFKKIQSKILQVNDIEELKTIRMKLKNIGMISISNFYIIEKFFFYLIKNSDSLDISKLSLLTEEQLINFLCEMSLSYKSSSVMLYKVVLGEFFRFLDKKRGYSFDFYLRNMSFNKEKVLPKFLSESKFLILIDYLKNRDFKKDNDKKNRLILLMISLSGMRSAEVRNLKLSDLNIVKDKNGKEYYSIKITGKGNKERMVAFKKEDIEKYLIEWLTCDLKKRKYNREYLFFNPLQAGSNTTRGFLIKTLRVLNLIDKKEIAGLHMLRHSFASYIYQNTKDIILTQNLLGHSSIETTRIYVHATINFSEQVLNLF